MSFRLLGSMLDNMMTTQSNLEQLLGDKETKLETILTDTDILTECKWPH